MPAIDSSAASRILVLGGGNFGTCLAHYLGEQGRSVYLWSIEPEVVAGLRERHRNPKYLTEFEVSSRVEAISEIVPSLLNDCQAIVLAIPTQAIREVLKKLAAHWPREALLVCAAKGIEESTLMLPIEIIRDTLGEEVSREAVFLSGPSFAEEIMRGFPTAVSVAGYTPARCLEAQRIFHDPNFRAYTCPDPIGLEVAGALKNVIAIAAGASQGLGYQSNSLAGLMTRGLGEIARVAKAMGGDPLTLNGLGGVGDLFLTCTSHKSRNFTVGFRLGRGEELGAILRTMGSVAEGVTTARAARDLTLKLGVETPIIMEVYRCLYEGKSVTRAVRDLLTRDPKPER
jgi:glycerol-3-phosphate dehydrogenase (NAD(P)+)